MKLLLVEDEEDLAQMTAKGLRRSGYAVDIACDGEEALYYYDVNRYDLIILDLNLPIIDGLDVLRHIRRDDQSTKIIILSARSRIDERVLGLDTGANDYLIKPFDFMELEARVRRLIRMDFVQQATVLQCGELLLDTAAKSVYLNKEPVSLTKKEYAVLEYLFFHQGTVVSAESLLEHVWDSEVDLFSNSLKFHIHSIKKKLEQIDSHQEFVFNIRGQGYILKKGGDGNVE